MQNGSIPTRAVRDIQTTINKARALAGGKTKVGLIGYSLGGRMAAFAAARTDIDASVGYYGVRIQIMLGEKDAIARPLLLHIAELDAYVDKQVQAEQHDFANEFGPLRSEDAVRLADQRTLAFIEANLGPTQS